MLKIMMLALVAVVWGPRASEASFLDDFNTPGLVNYTGSNSYGSGGSYTISGGKLNITVGNDNTFSVMTSNTVGFNIGDTLSLEVPASSGNHDVFMMCSTTAGQPDGSSTFGFRFRRDGAQYARMNLYPGGIIANTMDPSPDKPATLFVKRISDIDFEYSIKIEGAETQLGSFTLPSLAGIYNLHIGAQAYKLTSDAFAFDNLSIRSSRIHNITKDIWYDSIQLSIDGASNGDQIEVAPGTYTEAINFKGKAIRLYSSGGPAVTTIDATGLVSSVVTCNSGEGANTILQGFTITGGVSTQGGGMFNGGANPTVTNCLFSGNSAEAGGGMFNGGANPTVTNCIFSGNSANYGGGMWNYTASPTVTNCTFSSNKATWRGSGMYNEYKSYPTVTNCTFTSNTGACGMWNRLDCSPTVTNCIFWGNSPWQIYNVENSTPVVTYSDVQGGYSGTGNIDADPIFADGNGRLSPGSPCIDAGDNSAVTKATDLDGNLRIIDGDGNGTAIVDMGAYEIPNANAGVTGIKGTVVGVDSAGKVSGPLAGATVTLSGQETAITVTDSNGNFSFLNILAGDYTVKITKPDYWDSNSNITIEKNETLHEVFQLAYKSGSQSPVGYDFVSPGGKHFIEGTPGDIGFEITVAWNGAAGDVNFCIGNDCYPATVTDLGGGLARAGLTIPAPSIVNNSSKLTIDVVNGEGKHTYLNTSVRFYPVPRIINSWFGACIPLMVAGPYGDTHRDYLDEMAFIWDFPIKNSPASFNASFGYKRGLRYDLESGTLNGSYIGMGGFGLKGPFNKVTLLGEGELELAGMLDCLVRDGLPDIDASWQLSYIGRAGLEAPVIVAVEFFFPPAAPAINTMLAIPVVKDIVTAMKVRLYIIGGASIKGVYEGLESGDCFLGSTKVDVSGTFGVEIQVVVSWGPAEVGVYAGGTGTPSFQICPDFEFNSVTINAYVGFYAKLRWFKISRRYGLTIVIGDAEGTQALSAQLLGAASEGDVTWELASDSLKRWGPANRPVGSAIRELALTPKAGGTGSEAQTIAENVIDTACPSVVSDASQTMLLFSLHDVSKPDPCASDIGTFISTGGGAWSAGRIADDSSSDFVAKVVSIGSDSYLAAWERISGDVSEVNDPNKIDQINQHLEIGASWFNRNTGVWSALTEVTSNNFVDRSPMPVVYGSTTGIVWIQNDANYIGNSEYGDRLMFSEWSGSAWGTPRQLWSGPYGILSISFASDSNQGHIVFAVDLDGNTDDTRTDRELFGISTSSGVWGGALRLTNNDVEDSCPVMVNPDRTPIIVWDCNNTLFYTPLGAWNPKQVYSQYTLNNQAATLAGVTMADGAAIAYTVQGPSGVDIMASFYDAVLDRWSLPRRLTFDEDVESAVSLGFDGDRLIVAYLKTQTERNAVDVEIDGQMYHLDNIPEPGRTDLCILQHTLGYDLSVDSNSIVLEPANPKPGLPATIRATVANSGDLGAENVAVVFYNGDPDSGGGIIGDTQIIAGNLIPGGANEVSVSWDVSADISNSNEIFVVVDPCLAVDDRDRSNNTASKFAVLPDVEVENVWSTELSPNSVMLIARIANTGATAAKNVTVSWRIGSREGTEIGSDLISTLACNGVYEASWVWDVNGVFDGNEYVKVFGVASSASGVPDFDERNNTFSLVISNPGPANHPPVTDAGPDQTVYAWIDGIADVNLDGAGSYDEDGDVLTYKWIWTIDGTDYKANGVKPTIELPVGQHIISLIVNDGIVDSEPNEVNITVIGPVEANLCVMPKVLNRKSFQPKITAMIRLPKGITKNQIDSNEPLLLYPGQIEADWKWISRYFDYKCRAWNTTIFASFDKDELMDAIPNNGQVELVVIGQLTTGQYFFGTDNVKVISPGKWPWHKPWWNYKWNRFCQRPDNCRH
jgi:hypothetical protein